MSVGDYVTPSTSVALLAEGVGRNRHAVPSSTVPRVALLAEGVGRNPQV